MAPAQTFSRWPRHQHVFFDCDATLSRIEGIDVLAAQHGVEEFVEALTESAMSGDVPLEDVYHRRLQAIGPTDVAVRQVAADYKRNVVSDAREVIEALRRHGHDVYVVSGGLGEPVAEFATYLGVAKENVYAVELGHDALDGTWWLPAEQGGRQYSSVVDHQLATSHGKIEVISEILRGKSGTSLLIGDGITDMVASSVVDTFVGFGGVSPRATISDGADMYLTVESLAAVFALAGGSAVRADLSAGEEQLLEAGVRHVIDGHVDFADSRSQAQFLDAFTEESTT